MVSKRLTIALVAVLVHTGAVARPECDVLRQELNQAVTNGIGDGSRWNLFSGCEVVEWRAL